MPNKVVNAQSFNSQFYDALRNKDKPDFKLIRSISIPSNKVKGPMFEIFVRYTINSERYLKQQDSSLTKLSKMGYFNDAFSSESHSRRTEKEKKKIVKDFLAQADLNLDNKRKKIIKDSLHRGFRAESERILVENLANIKKTIKQGIFFFVDGKSIPDSIISMDFYIHPNAEEKGMLCFFPIDLTIGRHHLTYHKISPLGKSNKIDTFKMTIPFIYLGN